MAAPVGLNIDEIAKRIGAQKFPPVEQWEPDFCGDIDMRIKRDGSWHYMGSPIARERMVRLFSTVLRKDADGKTYLVTPVEKLGIHVEDAPFVAIAMEVAGDGDDQLISFTTNVGDLVAVDAEHPLTVEIDPETGEPSPYVRVRGRLDALIARAVFYDLVDHAEKRPSEAGVRLVVRSGGQDFDLGLVDDEEG